MDEGVKLIFDKLTEENASLPTNTHYDDYIEKLRSIVFEYNKANKTHYPPVDTVAAWLEFNESGGVGNYVIPSLSRKIWAVVICGIGVWALALLSIL